MKHVQRVLTLAATLSMLAGCGGGGAKSSVVPNAPAKASGPQATATLTLKFPAGFHHAAFPKAKPAVKMVRGHKVLVTAKTATSTRKKPQYVNPGNGNLMHVYAELQPNSGFGEYTPSAGVSLPSNLQPDGTQTISIGLPAAFYDTIEVIETDANGNELASGYYRSANIISASPNALELTMDMNARYIALTTDVVNGADAVIISQTNDGIGVPFCSYKTSGGKIFAFAADSTGGFVLPSTPAGLGFDQTTNSPAIPTPTLSGPTASLASTPLGIVTSFNDTGISTYASFVETNPDINFGGIWFGYATISDQDSVPCQLSGSFDNPTPNLGETVFMTVSGGNAPYAVAESGNTNCSVAPVVGAPTQFAVTANVASSECDLSITDANPGNNMIVPLFVNAPSAPLSLNPGIGCFSAPGQTATISISGGSGFYTVGSPSDNNVFSLTTTNPTNFVITAGSNPQGFATIPVNDVLTSEMTSYSNAC